MSDDTDARAINEQPWQPLPGMVKRRCEDCSYFFATPRTAQAARCPDCALRLQRRAAARQPQETEP